MSNDNKQGQYHLQEKREREQKAQEAIALVRAQEREKERNFVMRWERDPEDRTLWRWVKVHPRTEAEIKRYDKRQLKHSKR